MEHPSIPSFQFCDIFLVKDPAAEHCSQRLQKTAGRPDKHFILNSIEQRPFPSKIGRGIFQEELLGVEIGGKARQVLRRQGVVVQQVEADVGVAQQPLLDGLQVLQPLGRGHPAEDVGKDQLPRLQVAQEGGLEDVKVDAALL